MEGLTEEERKALRGSKFAPLPSSSSSRPIPRLAHPGGAVTTNKAAALAKFLERKLQEPDGLASLNPDILELAVKNAKATVNAIVDCLHQLLRVYEGSVEFANCPMIGWECTLCCGRVVRHVDSFADTEVLSDDGDVKILSKKPKKKEKKKKKKEKETNKKLKSFKDPADPVLKKRKKIKL